MSSVPSSPIRNDSSFMVAEGQEARLRKEIKKTILDFDSNQSYIEEEDRTYIYNNSSILDDDDELEDAEAEDDEDSYELDDTEIEIEEDDSSIVLEKVANSTTDFSKDSNSSATEKPSLTFYQFLKKHEIPRKLFHSSIGVLTLWLYTIGVTVPQLFIPLGSVFTVLLVNDLVRLNNPVLNEKICSVMSFVIRDNEYNSYNGTLFYLVGVLIVLYAYPKDISVLSILLLSWADTAASTFGRAFGKYTPQIASGKSLAGCLASCVTGVLTAYLWYGYFIPQYNYWNQPGEIYWNASSNKLSLPIYSLLIGVITSISEVIDLAGIDDNFTIPVFSGTCIYWLVRLTQQ